MIYHNSPDCQRILDHAHGNIILLKSCDKAPVMNDWVNAPSKINGDGRAYLDLGYNLGFRIPADHLVIDVDPRNGGWEDFALLPQEIQDLPVTTVTAGGGIHIYTLLPEGYDYKTLKTKMHPKDGIDFLHFGKQVVLPGSMLNETTGWKVSPSATFPPPAAPECLLDILKRKAPEPKTVDLDTYLSTFELDTILAMIPVQKYQDNDSWLKMAMACHHATDGEGLPAFLAWSLADPTYSDQGEIISRRWESMSTGNTPAPVTIRTLIKELAAVGSVPSWLTARAGMSTSPKDFFGEISAKSDPIKEAFETLAQQIDVCADHTTLLTSQAAKVGLDSVITESMREILIKKIATKTGTSMTAIRKDIKLMVAPNFRNLEDLTPEDDEEDSIADLAQPHTAAAQTAIASLSSDGVPPAYCWGKWLRWNGQFWSQDTAGVEVSREAHKALYNQGTPATGGAIKSVVEIMQTLMEVPARAFAGNPEEIKIHTPFHTLQFHKGGWVASRPSPENRNLMSIGAKYDAEAPLPALWLRFLDEVTTSEDARRTIACSIIYAAAQCRPWLRKAVYLYGPKRSGKSTLLNAVQDLLGRGNCSALNMRQLGSRFGSSSLVGKLANISNETVSKDTIQDDIFKALISGEAIEVEKKHQNAVVHHNTTKLFFAANGFPRVNDESDATWDRLTIISCPLSIDGDKSDPLMGERLKEELSGILLWAMTIFAEEMNKDKCISAMSMDREARVVMGRWREMNNPALRWLKERTTWSETRILLVDAAYVDYRAWCERSGHKPLNKIHFSRQIGQTINRGPKVDSSPTFADIELKPLNPGNFGVLD